jgi:CheY-like chemotaxis protein
MDPGMRERALDSLERNARAQAQLVEDLLDVSRIISGKLHLRAAEVDLGVVVGHAVETVRAGIAAKGLLLQVRVVDAERILVTGDADRLQQVVWNLVSNAIKFTPPGGRIDVEVRRADAKAEITVRDTGQGIPASFVPYLFERFRQMDASIARRHGGLGLGLSIVRHLTEAHGGTVDVESAGEGLGATFRVRLPLRAVVARDAPAALDAGDTPEPLADVRTLVVDDDADARELIRFVLESRGARVTTAVSVGEALHILDQHPVDVLVADIGMPDRDGYSLIKMLRDMPDAGRNALPAIAVTAYASVRERDAALAAGYNWHLGKPVDPEQLVATVAAAARRV